MTQTSAVIVGLAVGVGLIVLFGLMFGGQSSSTRLSKGFPLILIPYSGGNDATFVPRVMKVVIGVNNTVRWENNDTVPTWLTADNESDPDFFNATKDGIPLFPDKAYEYTFTKVGEFGFHGKPWQRGTVIVLPSQ